MRSGSFQVQLFRRITEDLYDGVAVEPGETAQVEVANYFEPELHLDPRLFAAWSVVSQTPSAVGEVLGEIELKSARYQASLTCGLAAYGIGDTVGSTTEAPSELLHNLYDSVLGGADCIEAIDKAEAEARGNTPQPLRSVDLTIGDLTVANRVALSDGFHFARSSAVILRGVR